MDGCFISSFYFRLPFTALPFSCAYPHTLPKSHFFFSSKCPLLSPFIAISLLHSFPPNQVLTSFSVSFIITPLSLSLASPFLFAIRISFLLPVLPLVFLSLSSPFCLFLISHSQVLPDSFTPLFFSHCLLSISTTLLFYPPCHSHVPLFIILDCFSLRFLPSYTLSYLFQSFCHSLFCFIFCFSLPSFPFKALNSELLLKRFCFFSIANQTQV